MSLSFVVIPANEELAIKSHAMHVILGGNVHALLEKKAENLLGESIKLGPLLLPDGDTSPGLYAYSSVPLDEIELLSHDRVLLPNIRATRLAMACGKFAIRFHGHVMLFRSNGFRGWTDLTVREIYGAACISPDLRKEVQTALNTKDEEESNVLSVPEWLANAAQRNYHDSVTISRLALVMTNDPVKGEDLDPSSDDDSTTSNERLEGAVSTPRSATDDVSGDTNEFVARSSLCLLCRGPSNALCLICEGAYFCERPRQCRRIGWSHECWCATWKLYAERRAELSTFPLGAWYLKLVGRDCQLSEEPYRQLLTVTFGVELDQPSWWRTEVDGWAGGESQSAQTVDATIRQSYAKGFAPVQELPPGCRVSSHEIDQTGLTRNALGLVKLSSWKEYYDLRSIPLSSPVALLMTFPLTVYYAIERFGQVPVTVANMMRRPLRVHVVGIEKEMNFLDLFCEVGYLLPEGISVDLTFVVREDMLPPTSRDEGDYSTPFLRIALTSNLKLQVISGTYGDDLDPDFDCGGSPDMIVGLNAGLFAYESWRSVVSYLYHHNGVVGVFTDYNEHSGLNCASLGGARSRESLCINPFRQPRAMTVLSMNLPQFSNGFIYVYNAQELDT